MKKHTSSVRTITTDNIFSNDRLGLDNSFEAGKSATLGLDYKKEFCQMQINILSLISISI